VVTRLGVTRRFWPPAWRRILARSVVTIVCAFVLLGALGAPSGQAASRFRVVASKIVAFGSDSERYVAWQVAEGSPITVLDTVSGRRIQIRGCHLFDLANQVDFRGWPAGHGRFIVFCGGASELLDARTGTMRVLPRDESGPSWNVVGARYVEGQANAANCHQNAAERHRQESCIALYEISTGVVSYRPQSEVGDLDRPGAPAVCPALRAKVLADTLAGLGDYSDQLFGEPGEPLHIWRCHGRAIAVHKPGLVGNLNIHGGLASWDGGHDATECIGGECSLSAVRRATVSAYNLSTGRRWTLKPPLRRVEVGLSHPVLGAFGYSSHTRRTLFWIATRTLAYNEHAFATNSTFTLYAAEL
jgi:hypothetical protein